MNNVESIFIFLFIFSLLNVTRTFLRFIVSLLQNPPLKMVLSSRELLILGLTVSYIITYLITN